MRAPPPTRPRTPRTRAPPCAPRMTPSSASQPDPPQPGEASSPRRTSRRIPFCLSLTVRPYRHLSLPFPDRAVSWRAKHRAPDVQHSRTVPANQRTAHSVGTPGQNARFRHSCRSSVRHRQARLRYPPRFDLRPPFTQRHRGKPNGRTERCERLVSRGERRCSPGLRPPLSVNASSPKRHHGYNEERRGREGGSACSKWRCAMSPVSWCS